MEKCFIKNLLVIILIRKKQKCPLKLGRSHQLVLGKHSGVNTVKHVYQELGISLSREQAGILLAEIRQRVTLSKQSLSPIELIRLSEELLPVAGEIYAPSIVAL